MQLPTYVLITSHRVGFGDHLLAESDDNVVGVAT